jgi:NAD-dependent dihydropyrimidine dehydrogenase PreA subunit
MPYPKSPRGKLTWFPTINYELCIADLGCLNFCPSEVFHWERDTGRPVVAHPHNCILGCDICRQGCKTGAISLPKRNQWREALLRLRSASATSGARLHLSKRGSLLL